MLLQYKRGEKIRLVLLLKEILYNVIINVVVELEFICYCNNRKILIFLKNCL